MRAATLVFCVSSLLVAVDASPAARLKRRCHHASHTPSLAPSASGVQSSIVSAGPSSSLPAVASPSSSFAPSLSSVVSISSAVPSSSSVVLLSGSALPSSSSVVPSSISAAPSSSSVAPPETTNVLVNGDFETPESGWLVKAAPIPGITSYDFNHPDAHNGLVSAAVKFEAGMMAPASFSQPITVTPNKEYTFSAWSKLSETGTLGCRPYYWIQNDKGGLEFLGFGQTPTDTPEWSQTTAVWYSSMPPPLTFVVQLGCGGPAPGGGMHIIVDDLRLALKQN